MIIGYKRVAIAESSWFAVSGSIVTDHLLSDGKPSTATRVQNTSVLMGFGANFDIELQPVRMIAVLGLVCSVAGGDPSAEFPAGSTIEITCGAYNTTVDPADHIGVDGRCNIYLVLPATINSSAIEVRITLGTVPSGTHYVDCGEIVVADAIEVCPRPGIAWALVDPTEATRTIGQQLHFASRRPYRRLSTDIRPTSHVGTFGSITSDIEAVRYALSRDRLGLVTLDDSTQETITRTTVFGRVVIGDIQRVENSRAAASLYTSTLTVEEIPASDPS